MIHISLSKVSTNGTFEITVRVKVRDRVSLRSSELLRAPPSSSELLRVPPRSSELLRVPPSSSERSSELVIGMISKSWVTVRVTARDRVSLRSSELLPAPPSSSELLLVPLSSSEFLRAPPSSSELLLVSPRGPPSYSL